MNDDLSAGVRITEPVRLPEPLEPWGTPSKRVGKIARLGDSMFCHARVSTRATQEEARLGYEFHWQKEREYVFNCSRFGQPCYGSWPDYAQTPIADMVHALERGDAELICDPAKLLALIQNHRSKDRTFVWHGGY